MDFEALLAWVGISADVEPRVLVCKVGMLPLKELL